MQLTLDIGNTAAKFGLFRGTHLRDPAVHLVQAREVRVSAGRPFRIYADGDPVVFTLTRQGLAWKVTEVRVPYFAPPSGDGLSP